MASLISSAILRTQSDERLVALSRAGQQRAFEAIVERYRAELTRSVHRFLPSASVEDVLQQTHLEAWKALSGGTEVRELRAWLHRIARNAALAVASRGYDYDELKDALLVAPGPEDELERREAVRRALRGIAELPERQREALLAVAVGGRSHAEVAFDLGITDTAARQLVRRARVSLLALATVLTPPQLVLWAARAGHTIVAGKAAAGAGFGGSVGGPAVKAGVVALAVGGVAVGVAPIRHALAPPRPPAAAHHHHHRHARTSHPPGYLAAVRIPAATRGPRLPSLAGVTPGAGTANPGQAHRVRSVSANQVGKSLPGAAAGSPPPASAPVLPTAISAAPTSAAGSAGPVNGLAALIAWAIAHSSQSPAGASAASFSGWSAGTSSPGAAGQASATGQGSSSSQTGSSSGCAPGPAAAPAPGQTQAGGGATGAPGASAGPAACGGAGGSTTSPATVSAPSGARAAGGFFAAFRG